MTSIRMIHSYQIYAVSHQQQAHTYGLTYSPVSMSS